jgi:hypothetical protein
MDPKLSKIVVSINEDCSPLSLPAFLALSTDCFMRECKFHVPVPNLRLYVSPVLLSIQYTPHLCLQAWVQPCPLIQPPFPNTRLSLSHSLCQTHRSLLVPRMYQILLPGGLHICHSICWNTLPSIFPVAGSLSFRCQLKCHLLREAFPNHTSSCLPHPSL